VKNMFRPLTALIAVVSVIALTTVAVKPATAAPTFLGSFAVNDGPSWTLNPPVYSGQDAAALLFGGLPTDYLISVDSSLDPTTITGTAHYDGWAESDTIFAQNFKLDTGGAGYNSAPGVGSAWSAYVNDHGDNNRNYVWLNDVRTVPVCDTPGMTPEPSGLMLLGTGVMPLFGLLRRRFLG
jgi:hypothetical protein